MYHIPRHFYVKKIVTPEASTNSHPVQTQGGLSSENDMIRAVWDYLHARPKRRATKRDSIPMFKPASLDMTWNSTSLVEIHTEFNTLTTTESFRAGPRLKIIGVWGVVVAILASMNSLDLFYFLFPRYRSGAVRLAVSLH